jgi:hypothetical protein
MRRLVVVVLATSSCLSAWNVSGPWACDESERCAEGLVCDDGVCCAPGGQPACPTLPTRGACPSGEPPTLSYRDGDGDRAGDPDAGRLFCRPPVKEAWVAIGDDCDDGDATIGPRASERCNALDDDCDGVIDNGTRTARWYVDQDQDGYGHDCDAGCTIEACAQPVGYASRAGDCAPSEPSRHPGAPERCNHLDDNCNGLPDDPPFVDVESPGDDGGARFDCAVATGLGECAAGGLQCVFDQASRQFEPTCVPRSAPQAEQCGDALDNDCDGLVDNPPGCGGPRSLLDARGATVRAVRLDLDDAGTVSGLPPRCLASELGARDMAWLNPVWVGSSPAGTHARHVWALQAPPGLWWDLSASSAQLALELELPFFINPAGWGGPGWFPNAVVTLCGVQPGEYLRLVPSGAGFTGTVSDAVHFWSPESGWRVESGPLPLDRRRVRALELVVSPVPPTAGLVTFTLEVRAGSGFR